MNANEKQIGGEHYKSMGDYQPWEVLRHWLTPEEYRGYQKGVVIAYLARERAKGGDQDLQKAAHHLQKLIEVEMQAEQAKDGWTPEAVKESAFPDLEDAEGGWVACTTGEMPCDGKRVVEAFSQIGRKYKGMAELFDWQFITKWRPAR